MSRAFLLIPNKTSNNNNEQILDVCIIGAGFSGMYQLHKLRSSNVQKCQSH